MLELLSAAGRAFLRAFAAALFVFALGLLAAPNLDSTYMLGVAALAAALSGGFRSLTAFVPQLTFSRYLPFPFGGWFDSFAQAFLATFLVTVMGMLDSPNLVFSTAAWTAVLVGAVAAGAHALQNAMTMGTPPALRIGLRTPASLLSPLTGERLWAPPPTVEVSSSVPIEAKASGLEIKHDPPAMSGRPVAPTLTPRTPSTN